MFPDLVEEEVHPPFVCNSHFPFAAMAGTFGGVWLFPSMMSSGWAVNVRMTVSDDLESSETYYARVSGRRAPEDAVRSHLAAPSQIIEARLPVQSSVFDALGIPDNGVVLRTDKDHLG